MPQLININVYVRNIIILKKIKFIFNYIKKKFSVNNVKQLAIIALALQALIAFLVITIMMVDFYKKILMNVLLNAILIIIVIQPNEKYIINNLFDFLSVMNVILLATIVLVLKAMNVFLVIILMMEHFGKKVHMNVLFNANLIIMAIYNSEK